MAVLSFASIVNAGATNKAGSWFAFHGWNHAAYTNSDITFSGDTYGFTLHDVQASDRQTDFGPIYIYSPTSPQTNVRLGYYFTDNHSVSFGLDHMKYVMSRLQTVAVEGTTYTNVDYTAGDSIYLEGFLAYEHTDGLNYWNLNYEYTQAVWESADKTQAFSLFVGPGIAFLTPRTNVTLQGYKTRNDQFQLSGFGFDAHVGLQYDFLTTWFFRAEVKRGFISLPWVSTTKDASDTASQSFGFVESIYSIGLRF